MRPAALHQTALRLLLCVCSSLATPLLFYSPLEGSTDEEEIIPLNVPLPTSNLSSQYQTTPVGPAREEADSLDGFVNFLEENMLLILVAGTLILLLFLIICGSVFMSRRRKVNAYYPSSFPSKMYVDHRDKTGGVKLFNEVQEKAAPEQEGEPVDSHRQLQADIMRAARSLRTPNKPERSDPGQRAVDHSPEDSSKADGDITDRRLPRLAEEKERSEISESEAASAAGSPELIPPEQLQPQEEDSGEASNGRSLRPSSLHVHSDSATLQLIAGEKTAF